MVKTAFIGLGVMGYPMAGYLQKAGHATTVYNRTTSKAEKWVAEYGGNMAETPAKAAAEADFVFLCVGNDNDLRDVTLGEHGVLNAMKEGSILVDHTTTSATVAKEVYASAKAKNIAFMDAPVSGGQAGAENGTLTIMVGGDADVYAKVEAIISCYFSQCVHMGEVGSGQQTKMCNQIAIAGAVQGVAESLHLAQKAGLDIEKAIKVMQKGSAGSWFMENRANTMNANEFDFGFAVDWMRKDLGIGMEEAQKVGAELNMVKLIDTYFAELQDAGHGRSDVSSLITRLT